MATFGTLKRLIRARTGNRADEVRVEAVLRDKLKEVWDSWEWGFRATSAFLTTIATKTAGTIALNATPTLIDGTGTAFAAGDIGGILYVGAELNGYTISNVVGQQLTLSSAYVGVSFTGSAYAIVQENFVLASDFDQLISIDRASTTLTKLSVDVNGLVTVKMHPVPVASTRIRYIYRKKIPSYVDGDEIPIRQDVLVYLAAADALFLLSSEAHPHDPALETLAQGYEAKGTQALLEFRFAPFDALLPHI